jgi:hypothetical protein
MRLSAALALLLSLLAVTAGADTAPAKPAKPAPPPADPACRALDGATKIAEAHGPSASDCSFNLRAGVKQHFCTDATKGKSFKFVVKYDHKLGARAWPDTNESMYCAK